MKHITIITCHASITQSDVEGGAEEEVAMTFIGPYALFIIIAADYLAI